MASELNGIAAEVVRRLGLSGYLQSDARHDICRVFHEAYRGNDGHGFLEDEAIRRTAAVIQIFSPIENYRQTLADLIYASGGNKTRANRKAMLYVLQYILLRSLYECVNDHDDWQSMEELAWAELNRMDVLAEDGHLNPFTPERIAERVERIRVLLELDRSFDAYGEPPSDEDTEGGPRPSLATTIRSAYSLRENPDNPRSALENAFRAAHSVWMPADGRAVETALAELKEAYGDHIDAQTFIAAFTLIYVVRRLRGTDSPPLLTAPYDYFEDRAIELLTLQS
jgi:hypothetical protein